MDHADKSGPESGIPAALRAQQRARRAQSESAILDAAADIFVARGYARTSVASIAKAARLSPATVYKAFGTKEAVFRAMVERELASARAPFLDGVPDFATAREALVFIAERHRLAFSNPRIIGLTQLAFAEAERFPELSDLYRTPDGRDPTQVLGEAVLSVMTGRGLFKVGNVAFAVRQFLGMLNQPVNEAVATGRPVPDRDAYIASCIDLFLSRYAA